MEKLKHIRPSKEYEKQAIEFIKEFYEHNSEIHGVGGLNRFLDNYEEWLIKLQEDRNRIPSEEKVPAETFFLVRENDNKIVGMINIRLALNEKLKKFGGNIGYCIRPKERQKGYNKINLYLGLKICQEHEIKDAMLTCYKDNIASSKTMKALGGILIDEWNEETKDNKRMQKYLINIDDSIKKYKSIYENLIEKTSVKRNR